MGHRGDHLPAPLWNLPVQPHESDSFVHLHKEGRVRFRSGSMDRRVGKGQGDTVFTTLSLTITLSLEGLGQPGIPRVLRGCSPFLVSQQLFFERVWLMSHDV